ncbi:glycosyltransferase family protein [Lysobacter solisilvae (ex Woo and Kim 2020)]|uniref:Glycosyltransferase n=1 Tax=Agrilutibacter terrestris TaxID=2865112 RepID=A0A7H0FZG6_9GAMM|nr:glycosyltransferase [Lysobacter terrestris]QNP41432.1 glycosyltransferase [Lysobacter terrestris]
MHDDHKHEAGNDASNPWADRINEAYYDAMGAAFGQKTRERINWMCAHARGNRVLDIGCSQGIASILMAREGMAVTGVDIYAPAIEYALAEREKEIESVKARLDFHCIELAALGAELFDTVVMGEVVEHQTNPVRFIQQGASHVAPGGRLVITAPYGLHPWPDHKSILFPGHVATAIADCFSIGLIEVLDGYVRVVADRRDAGQAGISSEVVLRATEQGALESQAKYYESNATAQALAKEKAELEARVAASQGGAASLERQRAELNQELALKAQALAFAEQTLSEARELAAQESSRAGEHALVHDKQAARIQSLLAEIAVQRSLSEQASEAIIGLEAAKNEAAKQIETLKRALDSANRELELVRASEIHQKAEHDSLIQRIGMLEHEMATAREERLCFSQNLEVAASTTASIEAERDEFRRRFEEADAQVRLVREEWQTQRNEASAATKALQARLDSTKDKLATTLAKQATETLHVERLEASADLLRNQLKELQHDLVVAQYKRHGHYAHLKAERERSNKLVAFARELHEDNQRYRHSAALAIGRACLGLTSVRGALQFPKAMLRAWNAYRNRESGSTTFDPIKLPVVPPVVLPPPPKAAPTSPAPGKSVQRSKGGGTAVPPTQEQHSKNLSVIGWRQEIEPASIPVMSVLDEFSRSCFAPQSSLVEPRPDNWEGLLEACSPKFLLVESSWKGNYGSWQYRVANYANPPGRELQEMVAGFRARGIPTVFWNKEDPVHFSNFIDNASKFDLVLTTASEAVPRYKERTSARVGVLQFAAEESLHNPAGSARRNGKVCFAGSFYANRFQERRDDQLMLLDAASSFDFDIYDRNFQPNPAIKSDFAFPERFTPFVRGRLPYDAIGRAYREYRVFLNVNSVIDSPTMFSRRVFELLACGTPVVSTWSKGTEDTFGNDLIWHVRNREEAEEAIRVLMTDDREWRRRSLAGIRAVLSAHTYRHRFGQVCQMVGVDARRADPFSEVLVAAEVATPSEAASVLGSFRRQVMAEGTSKRLLLACRGEVEVASVDPLVDIVHVGDGGLREVIERSRRPGRQRMLAIISPFGVYGRHYLQDLLNAARYSGAALVGKAGDGLESSQYTHDVALDPHALLINEGVLPSGVVDDILRGNASVMRDGVRSFATDSANFLRVDSVADSARIDAVLQQMEI